MCALSISTDSGGTFTKHTTLVRSDSFIRLGWTARALRCEPSQIQRGNPKSFVDHRKVPGCLIRSLWVLWPSIIFFVPGCVSEVTVQPLSRTISPGYKVPFSRPGLVLLPCSTKCCLHTRRHAIICLSRALEIALHLLAAHRSGSCSRVSPIP